MKKTVDLSKEEIQMVEDFQERSGAKNFSDAIRQLIKLGQHFAPKEAGEVRQLGKWKKHINIVDARKLSSIFCEDFSLEPCQIYYVDTFHDKNDYGLYFSDPATILLLKKIPNPIGVLMHELTHHLENEIYPIRKVTTHGYNYQLAKQRVITWCRNNISSKPDWSIPLKALQYETDMKKFRL